MTDDFPALSYRIAFLWPFNLWKYGSLFTMLDGHYAGEGWRCEPYGYKEFPTRAEANAWAAWWARHSAA